MDGGDGRRQLASAKQHAYGSLQWAVRTKWIINTGSFLNTQHTSRPLLASCTGVLAPYFRFRATSPHVCVLGCCVCVCVCVDIDAAPEAERSEVGELLRTVLAVEQADD